MVVNAVQRGVPSRANRTVRPAASRGQTEMVCRTTAADPVRRVGRRQLAQRRPTPATEAREPTYRCVSVNPPAPRPECIPGGTYILLAAFTTADNRYWLKIPRNLSSYVLYS